MNNCNCNALNDGGGWGQVAQQAAQISLPIVGAFVGQQQQQQWSAPECGKRPFFIGRRRNEWEACRAQSLQKQQQAAQTKQIGQSWIQRNKETLLIAGVGIAAFLLIRKR